MKSILKLSGLGLLLLSLAAFAPAAQAQTATPTTPPPAGTPPPDDHRGPGRMLEHMKKELNLTDDQVAKLAEIFKADRPAMEALHNNTSLSEDQKKEQMHALREASEAKIKAILTPEQFEKFKAMHHHGPKPEENSGAAPASAPGSSS